MAETESHTARLRPPAFEVDSDDPFAADRLNRKETVISLCSAIDSAQLPLVVSVEGAYGTGKSAFLRMCAAQLEHLGALTVEFNAWHQGHTGRPLIDLVAALTTKLHDKGRWDKLQEAAKQVGWRLARVASRGVFDRNDTDDVSVFDEWTSIENGIAAFKLSLREQVENLEGELVILVDELDRCEPLYALDLLNKARHLLDISGICMVFGVNREELGHAVQSQYGPACDVDGYLRRFVDISMRLRQPTTDEWISYLTGVFQSLSGDSSIFNNSGGYVRQILTLLADNCGGRIRDVEQVIRHAALTLPRSDYRDRWPLWVACLLALRYVDRAQYDLLASGSSSVWSAVATLRSFLSRDTAIRDLSTVDAIMLTMARYGEVSADREEFMAQYLTTMHDESAAVAAYEALTNRFWVRGSYLDDSTIKRIFDTIEMAAPV